MEIIVKIDNDKVFDILSCPLQGDRSECTAIKNSPISFCPDNYEDDDGIYRPHFPKDCPLHNGPVIVKKED
jgi:hypothetical protein